jgi:hypothetical protein
MVRVILASAFVAAVNAGEYDKFFHPIPQDAANLADEIFGSGMRTIPVDGEKYVTDAKKAIVCLNAGSARLAGYAGMCDLDTAGNKHTGESDMKLVKKLMSAKQSFADQTMFKTELAELKGGVPSARFAINCEEAEYAAQADSAHACDVSGKMIDDFVVEHHIKIPEAAATAKFNVAMSSDFLMEKAHKDIKMLKESRYSPAFVHFTAVCGLFAGAAMMLVAFSMKEQKNVELSSGLLEHP